MIDSNLRRVSERLFLAMALTGSESVLAQTSPAPTSPVGPPIGLVEAVRLTLARQPGIQLAEQRVLFLDGSLQASLAPFDVQFGSTLLASRERFPVNPTIGGGNVADLKQSAVDYRLDATKLFKSGLSVSPFTELTRRGDTGNPFKDSGSTVGFTIRQPLLRGRGQSGLAAASRSVGLEREASLFDVRQTASLSVLETVDAYWDYVASLKRLTIARESEERFVDLQKGAVRLRDAGEVAAVDINQLSANIARRRIARLDAEQSVYATKIRLGLVAGLDPREMIALGEPSDSFPEASNPPSTSDLQGLIRTATQRRPDIAAARQRVRASEVSVGASENATRPTLDLLMGGSYSSLINADGFGDSYRPLAGNVSGPSVTASLVFGFPFGNRAAQGRLAENQSLFRQYTIILADLERTAAAQVAIALNGVVQSAARASAATESTRLYREALASERQRLSLGLNTVLDVITTEDRLNESLIEALAASLDFAQAVARLRFETGTLEGAAGPGYEITLKSLVTPPPSGPEAR